MLMLRQFRQLAHRFPGIGKPTNFACIHLHNTFLCHCRYHRRCHARTLHQRGACHLVRHLKALTHKSRQLYQSQQSRLLLATLPDSIKDGMKRIAITTYSRQTDISLLAGMITLHKIFGNHHRITGQKRVDHRPDSRYTGLL